MLISADPGAVASTSAVESTAEQARAAGLFANLPCPPTPAPEQVRHLLLGTPSTVQMTILQLHQQGYAEPNDWSPPVSTGRAQEVMVILIKRIVAQRIVAQRRVTQRVAEG